MAWRYSESHLLLAMLILVLLAGCAAGRAHSGGDDWASQRTHQYTWRDRTLD